MRLSIKNIGKVKSSVVDIEKITVIAGENNTGKSTISRSLFSILNCFYEIDKLIERERNDSILQSLFMRSNSSDIDLYSNIVAELIENIDIYSKDNEEISKLILKYFDLDESEIEYITRNIKRNLSVSDENLKELIFSRKMNREFDDQINNIYSDGISEIAVNLKGNKLSVEIENDRVVFINNENSISINTNIVYIDDPFILDNGNVNPLFNRFSKYANHKELLRKLIQSYNSNVIDEFIIDERIEEIYRKISSVISGDIINIKNKGLGYRRKDSQKVLNVKNLSTGIKSFALLKILLLNGEIRDGGVLILDEPEIHLHPDWQLLFAEIIVLIQKEFGLHILINTHSPYFMRAIEVYADKHEILDGCKFYLAENKDNYSEINEVTGNTEQIYKKLSRAFQILEDESWK